MSASSSSSSSDSVPVAENSPPETQEDAASGEQRDYFERVSLEKIDENLFRASSDLLWTPPGARGVYGGQVLGQTLFAAANTVKQVDKRLHSLHAYFLRAGNADIPIIYYVSILRDGKSFSTRLVMAKQEGKTIFIGTASFQRPEPSRLSHQHLMPNVPMPWNLPTESERYKMLAADKRCPEMWKGSWRSAQIERILST